MSSKIRSLLLVLTLAAPLSQVYGLGTRIVDQDAEATARGEAFTATADNPSAVYFNPAGITQLSGENVSFGAYGIYLKDYVSPKGNVPNTQTTNTFQAAPHAYYTFTPDNFPLSFGLGFYAPFGFGLQYPDDTPFRSFATKAQLIYVTANPVVAWKITKQLSVAMGLMINYGDLSLDRGIFSPGDQFSFRGEGDSVGFNAGVMWQPIKQLSIGLNYRSQTSMKFVGHYDVKVRPYAAYGNNALVSFPSEGANAGIPFPQDAVFGLSYRPAKDWNIEFDLDWSDWNVLRTVTLNEANGKAYLPFNWNSSLLYEFGVTHNFDYGLRASAGYIYSTNSFPSANFNPIVPDSNRNIFSVGIGQDIRKFSWDLSYQFAFSPSRNISNGNGTDGTYTFYSNAINLSFGFKF